MTAQPVSAQLPPQEPYDVPQQFNRGFGAPLKDVRGRGFFYGVGALSAGAVSNGTLLLLAGLGGLSVIPGIIAIYLGILAIKNAKNPVATQFSAKAKSLGIWGIVLGGLGVLLSIALIVFFMMFASYFDPCTIYEPDTADYETLCLGSTY